MDRNAELWYYIQQNYKHTGVNLEYRIQCIFYYGSLSNKSNCEFNHIQVSVKKCTQIDGNSLYHKDIFLGLLAWPSATMQSWMYVYR